MMESGESMPLYAFLDKDGLNGDESLYLWKMLLCLMFLVYI